LPKAMIKERRGNYWAAGSGEGGVGIKRAKTRNLLGKMRESFGKIRHGHATGKAVW